MATTEEAKIIVKMEAETKRLQTKLDQAEKKIKRFEGTTKQATEKVSRAFKAMGIAVAAGAAATVLLVNNTRKVIDEQAKLAALTNSSVREFQQGAYAVSLYGIEQEKYADILKDVNDKIGDFLVTGGGPLKDFFDEIAPKIGVTAEEFRNLSGREALQLYVSSLEKANLSQQEMTFFMEAIASDSAKLLPAFENNGKALAQMSDEADKLGLTLSEVDAAQVEAANKALKAASAVSDGAANRLTVALAPSITAVANLYREAALQSSGFGDVASTAGELANFAIGEIVLTIEDVTLGIKKSKAEIANFAAAALELGAKTDKFFSFGGINKGLAESAKKQEVLAAAYRSLGNFYAKEYEKGLNDRLENGDAKERFKAQLEAAKKALRDAVNSGGDTEAPTGITNGGSSKGKDPFAQSLSQVESLLKSIRSPLQEYTDNIAILDSLVQAKKINQDDYNLAFSEYTRQLQEATPGIQNMQELTAAIAETLPAEEAALAAVRQQMLDLNLAMEQFPEKAGAITDALINLQEEEARLIEKSKETGEELTEFGKEAARNIQNELGDTLRSTLEGDFDGILDSWGNMLAEMGYQLIAQNFADAFDLESLFSTDSSSKGGGLGSFFGGFFADGGRPPMGKASIVGERGPELFVPDSAGTIVPNGEMGGQSFSFGNVVLNGVTNEAEATKAAGKFMSEAARMMSNAQRYT